MSTALAVCHGVFGRVTVYKLDRPMRMHAHREGHLIFYLAGPPGIVTISGKRHLVDQYAGVAINPWQPHDFKPCRDGVPSVILVAYICDRWLDRDQEGRGSLRFGANRIDVRNHIRSTAYGLADALVTMADYRIVDRGLNDLFDACFEESWSLRGRPIYLAQQRDSGRGRDPPSGGFARFRHRYWLRARVFLAKPFHSLLFSACWDCAHALSHDCAGRERIGANSAPKPYLPPS
jgi:hypothetical protein